MALSRLNLHAGRWFAFFGAGFLIVPSAIILFIYFGSNQDIPNYDDGNYTNRFDPNWLRKLWEFRRNEFSYMLAIDFFACMVQHSLLEEDLDVCAELHQECCSLFLPGWQPFARAGVFAKHGRFVFLSLSLTFPFCFTGILLTPFVFRSCSGSSFLPFPPSPLLFFLLFVSFSSSSLRISFLPQKTGLTEAYNISVEVKEDSALQALEVAYRVSEARSIWVFSLIYLFISLSIVTASFLFWTYQEFESKTHAVLGLFVGFIGIATLIVEVSWWFVDGLRMAFGLMTLFWGVVLVPGWLIFLGWRIGRFVSKGGHHRSRTGDDMTSSIGDIEMESNISI